MWAVRVSARVALVRSVAGSLLRRQPSTLVPAVATIDAGVAAIDPKQGTPCRIKNKYESRNKMKHTLSP